MKPILQFSEKRCAYGIELRGIVTLESGVTIPPNYTWGAIDKRKQAEGYIYSLINQNFIRLRGYYKILDAMRELEVLVDSPEKALTMRVLNDLAKELQEPQFEIKGNAK